MLGALPSSFPLFSFVRMCRGRRRVDDKVTSNSRDGEIYSLTPCSFFSALPCYLIHTRCAAMPPSMRGCSAVCENERNGKTNC